MAAKWRLRKDRAVLEGHTRGDGATFEVQDIPVVVAHAFVTLSSDGGEIHDCGGGHGCRRSLLLLLLLMGIGFSGLLRSDGVDRGERGFHMHVVADT